MKETVSGFEADASFSVFEAFKPRRGARVLRVAVLTYSLDLVALTALVLALASSGEEDLAAEPLALVDALRSVAPGLVVLYQQDRLVASAAHFGVLHLLDRRLRPVRPRPDASWHPKLILARYEGDADAPWRLWIGSRNLTGGRDREAGLVLHGSTRGPGRRQTGIGAMARDLLGRSGWSADVFAELDALRWRPPDGVTLRGVEWRREGERRPFVTPPRAGAPTLVVSPFVDDSGLDHLLPPAPSSSMLVTTVEAAEKVGARVGLDVRCVDAPDPTAAVRLAAGDTTDGFDEVAESVTGLHAKLVLRRGEPRSRLWIGSANATARGITGPNAELMVELGVTNAVADGLWTWALSVPPERARPVDEERKKLEAARRRLDRALTAVFDRGFRLEAGAELRLVADGLLDDFLEEHALRSRSFTSKAWCDWSVGTVEVTLERPAPPLASRTTLVAFEAVRRDDPRVHRSWAQPVDFPKLDLAARDLAATAAYVGVGRLARWLQSRLEGLVPGDATDWTGARRGTARSPSGVGRDEPQLTLETVLASWARSPADFEARIPEIDETLRAFRRELARDETEEARAGRAQLAAILPFWRAVKASLELRRGA